MALTDSPFLWILIIAYIGMDFQALWIKKTDGMKVVDMSILKSQNINMKKRTILCTEMRWNYVGGEKYGCKRAF